MTAVVQQNQNLCNQYTCNPYMCAKSPQSNIIIPQGQINVPNSPAQLPQVQAISQVKPSQTVNYNQITPYINTNSGVFHPSVQTRSGQAISTANAVSTPVSDNEAQLVYQGPIKTVNPQITPIEQSDNQIEKDFNNYFKFKAEENAELKNALNKSSDKKKKPSNIPKAVKMFLLIASVVALYNYRKSIPFVKKLFK